MSKTWVHLHLPRWKDFLLGGPASVNAVKRGREKMDYTHQICLKNAEFKVSEKGRQRTLATGQRNVHAWVVGEERRKPATNWYTWKRAVYSPFKGPKFVDAETLTPLDGAYIVVISGKDVYYKVGRYA